MTINTLANQSIVLALLDAVAAGTQTGDSFTLPSNASLISYQSIYTGSPSAINITIEGSVDNTNWQTLATLTNTAGEQGTIITALPFIRAKVNSNTGGTLFTVKIIAKPYTIQNLYGPNLVHQVSATLTDADIKALPSTPFVLVPATQTLNYSGTPELIPIPSYALGIFNFSSGAYTNLDADSRVLFGVGSDWSDDISHFNFIESKFTTARRGLLFFQFPKFFASTANIDNYQVVDNIFINDNFQDNALVLACYNPSGALTGGNADNTLEIIIQYHLYNTVTGLFE